MQTNAQKVKIMMLRFGQTVPTAASVPDPHTVALRANLIKEEYEETMEAIQSGNIKEVAKELCDLLVVTYGTLLAYGVDPDYAFSLVHRSNMSKLGADGKPSYREDGKVLKGASYIPPDMSLAIYAGNKDV
jgi:predicted HAD superfamily Cof-like phosphohydrolase